MVFSLKARGIPPVLAAAVVAVVFALLTAPATAQECEDKDELEICYKPILCGSRADCVCSSSATATECGRCPNDGGSTFRVENVCHCYTQESLNEDGVECNPLKRGGPMMCESGDCEDNSTPAPPSSTTTAARDDIETTAAPSRTTRADEDGEVTTVPSTTAMTDDPSGSEEPGTSLPVGAIAGGAIGGVLALMAVLCLLLCLRRKKGEQYEEPQTKERGPGVSRQAPGYVSPGVGKATATSVDVEAPGEIEQSRVDELRHSDSATTPWASSPTSAPTPSSRRPHMPWPAQPPLPDGPPPNVATDTFPAPAPRPSPQVGPDEPPLPLAPPNETTPPPHPAYMDYAAPQFAMPPPLSDESAGQSPQYYTATGYSGGAHEFGRQGGER